MGPSAVDLDKEKERDSQSAIKKKPLPGLWKQKA